VGPDTVSRLADAWLVGSWEALFAGLAALACVWASGRPARASPALRLEARGLRLEERLAFPVKSSRHAEKPDGSRPGPGRPWWLAGLGCFAVAYLAVNTVGTPAAAPDSFLTAPPRTALLMKHLAPGGFPPRFVTHPPVGPLPLEHRPSSFLMLRAGRELMTQARGIPAGCNPLRAGWAFRLKSAGWLDDLLLSSPVPESDRAAAAAGAFFSLRAGRDETLGEGPDTLLGQSGLVGIWRLGSPTPRVFIAGKARPALPGEQLPSVQALAALPGEAVFEGGEPAEAAQPLAPSKVTACAVERYSADRLSVRFELAGRGLLVLLEQFYPGWEARVDGRPRPIVPVAGLFRGVEVAEGEHLLEMCYAPGLATLGWVVSLLTLAGLLLVAWGKFGPYKS
jgi:hypothetical protein